MCGARTEKPFWKEGWCEAMNVINMTTFISSSSSATRPKLDSLFCFVLFCTGAQWDVFDLHDAGADRLTFMLFREFRACQQSSALQYNVVYKGNKTIVGGQNGFLHL